MHEIIHRMQDAVDDILIGLRMLWANRPVRRARFDDILRQLARSIEAQVKMEESITKLSEAYRKALAQRNAEYRLRLDAEGREDRAKDSAKRAHEQARLANERRDKLEKQLYRPDHAEAVEAERDRVARLTDAPRRPAIGETPGYY